MTHFLSCFLKACALFFFVIPPLFAQEKAVPSYSLSEKSVFFKVDSTKLNYALPDSFVIPQSIALWTDSTKFFPEIDYVFAEKTGLIQLKKPIIGVDLLHARYRIFPVILKKKYVLHPIVHADTSTSKIQLSPSLSKMSNSSQFEGNQFSSQLRRSGSIIRGVSIGTDQNLKVDSGLRFQLSGKLTENVEVIASLTDQNTPIQPEGNTQSLQEIDKVFIQLKAPRFSATLGDYTLDLKGTDFTNYSRKLEGITARGEIGGGTLTVSGAVSRGQFASNEFTGEEGNQGPYQLRGSEGQINIIVLAGTERLWVDGELMTRGENHDYTIQYGNGQITFTRQRLITSDSRIVVDFQFSDESFQRNYWAARAEYQLLEGRLGLKTTFIRESDDKDNPLRFALSAESLTALQDAGDDLAVVPGDTLVGPGQGNYTRDSTGVFNYVGNNLGDYQVSFSFFGPNQGDYSNIGLGRFKYAGENQGDYRPFILLPVAQQHDVVGFNLDLSPTSAFRLNSEVAFSQFDANLYSSRDDRNNQGVAYNVKFDFQPDTLKLGAVPLGRFSLTGNVRQKSNDYRDVDRTTIAEFNRRWDIPSVTVGNRESIRELQGNFKSLSGLELHGGVGILSKSSSFNSNRWDLGTGLHRLRLPQFDYYIEFIDRRQDTRSEQSKWLRHRGNIFYELGVIRPTFEYEGEIKKESNPDSSDFGFRFDSYTGGVALSPSKFISSSFRYNVRDDKERTFGEFKPRSIARTQSYSFALKNWHALSVNASFTHRTREFSTASRPGTRTDLADIRLGYTHPNRGFRGNLYYQISTKRQAQQEEVYFEVGEGEGNFRFNEDRQEFEPDPFGDFVRRLISTNTFRPVAELRLRADLRFSPKKFVDLKYLNPITSETFFRIDERTGEDNVARIYLLNLRHFQRDSTIFGNIELRQDTYFWKNNRKFSLRYRFRTRRELNNQFVGGSQKRRVYEHALRWNYKLSSRVNSEVELTRLEEDRLFQSIAREDRKVRSSKIDLDVVYRPRPRLEIGIKSSVGISKDVFPIPETDATLLSFTPRINYSLNQNGRLRADLEWTQVKVSPKNRLIPYELTNGRRDGTNFRWSLNFEYRVSRYVQLSLSYFGRNEPDRPKTQHLAKIEMRAFF